MDIRWSFSCSAFAEFQASHSNSNHNIIKHAYAISVCHFHLNTNENCHVLFICLRCLIDIIPCKKVYLRSDKCEHLPSNNIICHNYFQLVNVVRSEYGVVDLVIMNRISNEENKIQQKKRKQRQFFMLKRSASKTSRSVFFQFHWTFVV